MRILQTSLNFTNFQSEGNCAAIAKYSSLPNVVEKGSTQYEVWLFISVMGGYPMPRNDTKQTPTFYF